MQNVPHTSYRAVGRFENPGEGDKYLSGSHNLPPPIEIWLKLTCQNLEGQSPLTHWVSTTLPLSSFMLNFQRNDQISVKTWCSTHKTSYNRPIIICSVSTLFLKIVCSLWGRDKSLAPLLWYDRNSSFLFSSGRDVIKLFIQGEDSLLCTAPWETI